MGYKKIAHKSKEEGKIKRCVECLKRYNPEPEDDGDTCPRCAKRILVQVLEEDNQRELNGPLQINISVVE
jgi:DNA-directed RNA polymerase subunit RPC12/RpoP